ncbi:MAG: glycine betaine ABC transporter substrate-binding protein, partial [Pseudomonadota bacterium]
MSRLAAALAVFFAAAFALLAMHATPVVAQSSTPLVIGSKTFPESYLLAELMAQTLEQQGIAVKRQFGFGGTLVCYEALRRDEIQLYPEYTGTIVNTILSGDGTTVTESGATSVPDLAALNAQLDALGLLALPAFGFDNTYALAMDAATAARLGIGNISDLRAHGGLRIGLSHEFRNRQDGWPGLAAAYDLPQLTSGIDHGLAYQAIAEDELDVTDAYSTDGDIERFDLVILDDDRDFFPGYLGVPLASAELPENARTALAALGGLIDDATM